MKKLTEFIAESLTSSRKIYEGGMSVDGAEHIRGDLAKGVADEIISKLRKHYGSSLQCAPLGSTGKKGRDQMSGDIDIAIEKSWDDYKDVMQFVQDELNISGLGNVNQNLHVFNFGYRYDEDGVEKIVQVDFMFVNSVEFAEFAYHSPNFVKNESKYKGMYQSALLMAVISNTPVEDILGSSYKEELFTDEYDGKYRGDVKSYWKFNLTQSDGVKLTRKSYEGKTKPVKTAKNVESKVYTDSVSKILKEFLGDEATKDSCNSFESLLGFLVSDKYKFRSVDMLNKIKDSFMSDWQIKMKTDESVMKEFGKLFDEAIKLV